jgi:hypothetical protein
MKSARNFHNEIWLSQLLIHKVNLLTQRVEPSYGCNLPRHFLNKKCRAVTCTGIAKILRRACVFIYLIYKDECLFVCLFVCMIVPYTNPHFWTDRNQTLHTSHLWSGRECRVCTGPKYFTFPTFSAYFVGSGCRFLRSRWLSAPH